MRETVTPLAGTALEPRRDLPRPALFGLCARGGTRTERRTARGWSLEHGWRGTSKDEDPQPAVYFFEGEHHGDLVPLDQFRVDAGCTCEVTNRCRTSDYAAADRSCGGSVRVNRAGGCF